MTSGKTICVWFRNDLRTLDNPALASAFDLLQADSSRLIIGLFTFTPKSYLAYNLGSPKINFVLRSVLAHSQILWDKYKIPLFTFECPFQKDVPEALIPFLEKYKVNELLFNIEYEVNEAKRDENILRLLKGKVNVTSFHDQCIVPPNSLRSKASDSCYVMYTPFKNAWFDLVKNNQTRFLSTHDIPANMGNNLDQLKELGVTSRPDVPYQLDGFELGEEQSNIPQLWPVSETVALQKLQDFAQSCMKDYKALRDYPAVKKTSGLSPYLAVGSISAKQCVKKAMEINHAKLDSGNEGDENVVQ